MFTIENSGSLPLEIEKFVIIDENGNNSERFFIQNNENQTSGFTLKENQAKDVYLYYKPDYEKLIERATLQVIMKTRVVEYQIEGFVSIQNRDFVRMNYAEEVNPRVSRSHKWFNMGLILTFGFVVIMFAHFWRKFN